MRVRSEGKAHDPEKCHTECSLRFVIMEGEWSAGPLIFPQRHAAVHGGGFARCIQWRERGPWDGTVFTVAEMMAGELKLCVNTSESGRGDSALQKVEGQTLVTGGCFYIVRITGGSPLFRMSGMAGLFTISGKIWVSHLKYTRFDYLCRGFFKSKNVTSIWK